HKHQQGDGEGGAQVEQAPQAAVIDAATQRQMFHELTLLFIFDKQVECHVNEHDEEEEDQSNGEEGFPLQRAHGGVVHLGGDGGGEEAHGGKQAAGHVGHVAGDHDDGHGLADGTAHAQHDGGGHTGTGGGERDPEDGLGVGGAQSQGGLLILLGHSPQSGL